MFDQEEGLKDGITIRVYNWDSQMDGKPMMSMMVRMVGEKCAKGEAVLKPILNRQREARKADLEDWKPKGWLNRARLLKTDEEKKKEGQLNALVANPLFDLSPEQGNALLDEIKEGLKEQGLTMTVESQKSNGEMNELVLHWA